MRVPPDSDRQSRYVEVYVVSDYRTASAFHWLSFVLCVSVMWCCFRLHVLLD